jgi:fucose permease
MGFGFAIPASNVAVSELNPERRAAALNLLNFCWCIGAVLAAPGVALFRDRGKLAVPQAIIVALSIWVAVWLHKHAQVVHPLPEDESHARRETGGDCGIGLPWVLAVLGFLYVGTESSIGGWATSYAQRLSVSGSNAWVIAQSAFWAALLAGRAAAPLALRRLTPEKLVLCCLILSSAGVAAVLVSSGAGSLIAAVALCGIGLAAVFPTVAGIYTQIQSSRSVHSAGMYFVLSSFGGAALPWLVGLISMRTGSLRFGMVVPAAATAAMIALQLVVISRLRAGSKSSRGNSPE